MAVSKFQGGSRGSVFSCRYCTRKTRDVNGNAICQLCPQCDDALMTVNGLNDYGHSMSESEKQANLDSIARNLSECQKLGGVIESYL